MTAKEPRVLSTLKADFQIIFERDPAARNWLEVIFCYPGLQAIVFHRLSHWLWRRGIPFIPPFDFPHSPYPHRH